MTNALARQLYLSGALPRALGGVGKPHAVRIIWRWFFEKKRPLLRSALIKSLTEGVFSFLAIAIC
jgi:hypothetical protein